MTSRIIWRQAFRHTICLSENTILAGLGVWGLTGNRGEGARARAWVGGGVGGKLQLLGRGRSRGQALMHCIVARRRATSLMLCIVARRHATSLMHCIVARRRATSALRSYEIKQCVQRQSTNTQIRIVHELLPFRRGFVARRSSGYRIKQNLSLFRDIRAPDKKQKIYCFFFDHHVDNHYTISLELNMSYI